MALSPEQSQVLATRTRPMQLQAGFRQAGLTDTGCTEPAQGIRRSVDRVVPGAYQMLQHFNSPGSSARTTP